MRIALAISTFNRIIDAKIQMELVRNLWSSEPDLKDIEIYHGYNGNPKDYKDKYLENYLYYYENPGHYKGACLLINNLMKEILNSGVEYDFIIAASADTWIINPQGLRNVLETMKENKYQLATSRWFLIKSISTEFFIITPVLAKRVFPLNYDGIDTLNFLENKAPLEALFRKKVEEVLNAHMGSKIWKDSVYMLPGIENIHWLNHRIINYYHKPLGHIATHDLRKKSKILANEKLENKGKYIKEAIDAL